MISRTFLHNTIEEINNRDIDNFLLALYSDGANFHKIINETAPQ